VRSEYTSLLLRQGSLIGRRSSISDSSRPTASSGAGMVAISAAIRSAAIRYELS
jgi:hypothetical protein